MAIVIKLQKNIQIENGTNMEEDTYAESETDTPKDVPMTDSPPAQSELAEGPPYTPTTLDLVFQVPILPVGSVGCPVLVNDIHISQNGSIVGKENLSSPITSSTPALRLRLPKLHSHLRIARNPTSSPLLL
ncbi:hypothetical protein L2E82_22735 [Cichorium intybus]|uniref:Uncharacterized protein n=1 Tax=Cichorium intybus TaxID=13427 RepID=A0ACB9DY17_CICIN|nr:hypothetical protein L2E82_22735 [Cichorium intybus]